MKEIDARTLPYGTKFRVINGNWEGYITVVNGVKGVQTVGQVGHSFPLTGNEDWVLEVYDVVPEFSGSVILTTELRDKIYLMMMNGCSDSDLEDFCNEYKIPQQIVFHYVAIMSAPDCCKRCKNVDFYKSMYPCTSCKRANQTEYFEEYTE